MAVVRFNSIQESSENALKGASPHTPTVQVQISIKALTPAKLPKFLDQNMDF
ncbi:hypothetical protein BH11ARM1_BH11ARM1_03130 [soil metagenome]